MQALPQISFTNVFYNGYVLSDSGAIKQSLRRILVRW